jgi:rhamnulose-1-phosphate aldolase/alcohol dehydrogenase
MELTGVTDPNATPVAEPNATPVAEPNARPVADPNATPVGELLERSHRLGADPANTNYAGGNTSAKGAVIDPVTARPVDLLWVKGSGGDLGTLTEAGLAVLRLDRLRALADVYPGVEREDEMVAAFDFCLHGKGGAAPSIDTASHALVDAPHVDHLHPDSGIALATAADGEALTKECFGDRVAWIGWRRPGFQLGLDTARVHAENPQTIGAILGGHGITAWGDTSEQCEANTLEIITGAARFITERGVAEPFGPVVPGYEPLPEPERHARAAALAPLIRGLASTDVPVVGHYTDTDVVLDFCSREKLAPLAASGTSCPDHFLRTKVRPLVLDLPATTSPEEAAARLKELHTAYRGDYAAYYARHAAPDSPPMRGADPAIVLVPGVGMFSFGANAQTARVAGEFYVNAINVMRGAEAVSRYAPIDESEKFRIEYWALEEAKLRRMPNPRPLAGKVALVTGAGSGIGRAIAHRLAGEGAAVVVADRDTHAAVTVAGEIAAAVTALRPADAAVAVSVDVTDPAAVRAAFDAAVRAYGGIDVVVNNAGLSVSKPLAETTEADWDLQHDVMAKGSFLVSQQAARVLREQNAAASGTSGSDTGGDTGSGTVRGGDIVYISSKNSLFAGPNNVAYGAAKADQAHQVRLLAAELGPDQIRVNGINPDGVVRGSGIFAHGWGAQRAAVYGVQEDELGEYYAQRTLLKREVLPEHVANAVFALVGGDLTHTTGLHIPVDAGVAAAFLR